MSDNDNYQYAYLIQKESRVIKYIVWVLVVILFFSMLYATKLWQSDRSDTKVTDSVTERRLEIIRQMEAKIVSTTTEEQRLDAIAKVEAQMKKNKISTTSSEDRLKIIQSAIKQ